MERVVHSVVQIAATPRTVYETLTNTSYIIKIFRDAVSVQVDPPGNSVVGQKYHLISKAGRRKVDIYLRVIELVPERKVVTVQDAGGIFKEFRQTTILEPRGRMTEARTSFEYTLSLGYIGKVLNVILVENLIKQNLEHYSAAVKELSELLPIGPTG